MHGTFTLREGDIHVADPVSESSARARISAASFWTGNTSRDRTVRSAGLLDAAAHPDITFTSNRLDHAGGRWIMHGLLSVRGTARPVEVLVEETQSRGPELRLRASVRLDRYDFEITRYRGLAVRRLDCRLDVVAHRL